MISLLHSPCSHLEIEHANTAGGSFDFFDFFWGEALAADIINSRYYVIRGLRESWRSLLIALDRFQLFFFTQSLL